MSAARGAAGADEDHPAQRPRLPPLPRVRGAARPGPDDHPRPERGRQDDDPARDRARSSPGRRPRTRRDMDGLRSWDAPLDARPVIAIDFEIEDEENGIQHGSIEKAFRGAKGTVRLEVDGEVITDPTLADQALAELTGIPSEAFFRSTASIRHHELADLDRDEAALRDRLQASISGADRGHLAGQAEARAGDLRPEHEGREESRPPQGRRGGRRPGAGRGRAGRARPRPAGARSRHAGGLEGAPRGVRRRPRRASVAAREGAPGRAPDGRAGRRPGAVRALPPGGQDLRGAGRPPRKPPIAESAAGARAGDRTACAGSTRRSGSCGRPCPARSPSSSRSRPSRRGGRSRGSRSSSCCSASWSRRRRSPPGSPRSSTSERLPSSSAGRLPAIGFILAFVAFWLRRNDRMQTEMRDVEIDRRLRGRSEMEQELKQAEADTVQQLAGIGLDGPGGRRGPARGRAGARRRGSSSSRRSSRGSSARSPSRRCPACATRRRSRSSRRPTPSRRSARSPASHGPASGSRSRSGISRLRSSGPATTRRTPGRGSRPTPSTPKRSPRTPSAWPLAGTACRAPAPSPDLRADPQRDRAGRAGDDEVGDPLPRDARWSPTSSE